MANSTRLSFRGTPGPGPSDVDPVALIVDTRAAEKRSQASSSVVSQELLEQDYEQRYGAALSLVVEIYLISFQCTIAFMTMMVGLSQKHLSTRAIPLWVMSTLFPCPHLTLSSLKNHIIKCEDVSGYNVQLFEDEGSESAMNDSDVLTLLSDTSPRFSEDQPIEITYESGMKNGED